MNRRYLYLESNDFTSKQCFTNNNNSSFSIQLPLNLDLKNNATASLKSIFIPNTIRNRKDYKMNLYFTNGSEKFIPINEDTDFESAIDFIKYLNKFLMVEGLMCALKEGKLSILKSLKSKVDKIKFSPTLRMTLGFPTEILTLPKSGKLLAQKQFNLNLRDISFLIVEIDIVEKTVFGENNVGILKILPLLWPAESKQNISVLFK